jgi:hypothetical protein
MNMTYLLVHYLETLRNWGVCYNYACLFFATPCNAYTLRLHYLVYITTISYLLY